jgi:hypothetical protein
MSKVGGEDEQFDPREIFTKLFGGEAFYDYVSELEQRVNWADSRLVKSLLSKVIYIEVEVIGADYRLHVYNGCSHDPRRAGGDGSCRARICWRS